MNASLLLNWRKEYWDEHPYESPAKRLWRRARGIIAPLAVLIGLLLGFAAGGWMLLAYTLAGIWIGVMLLWPDHGFLWLYCLLTIYPISRVITISLKPTQSLTITSLALIPKNATLDNYRELFTDQPFTIWVWNSFLITITVSIIGVMIAATSAYAFSRWRFPGRSLGLLILLSTQMIPAGMLLIPIFIIVARLGLQNNLMGLALAYVTTAVPLSVWILRGYYDTIPFDLEEAAMVDGSDRMSTFWRIILPLSTPALAVIFLFNFLNAWSDWQVANIILKANDMKTWPLGINTYINNLTTQWGLYAAASVLITVPVVILFLYSSKYLISGLTLGSVKG